jgi:mRNA interferase MazF
MGKFVKGDIVIIPFPFTDLSGNKKRPAFVAADLNGGEDKIRDVLNAVITIISS